MRLGGRFSAGDEDGAPDNRSPSLSVLLIRPNSFGGCEVRIDKDGVANISYFTVASYLRRGVGTRAVRLAAHFALRELGVDRLEIRAEVDNGSRLVRKVLPLSRRSVRLLAERRLGLLRIAVEASQRPAYGYRDSSSCLLAHLCQDGLAVACPVSSLR